MLKLFWMPFLAVLSLSCQKLQHSETIPLGSDSPLGVIGGAPAAQNEFLFIVNIWQNSPRENFVDHLCGGSLIADKWVLTAAHCMLETSTEDTQKLVSVRDLNLYIGSNHISGRGGKAFKAKKVIIHPQFSWPNNDIALIELESKVLNVTPVTLNKRDLDAAASSTKAVVIGWGLTDAQGRVDGEFLQKLTLQLISRKTCSEDSFPIQKRFKLGPETLCASTTKNSKASCPGDSGGPLVTLSGSQYIQLGVVSWGSACGGDRSRNGSNVEGYADVANAFNWIQRTIVQPLTN